jgi:hypothetical protein
MTTQQPTSEHMCLCLWRAYACSFRARPCASYFIVHLFFLHTRFYPACVAVWPLFVFDVCTTQKTQPTRHTRHTAAKLDDLICGAAHRPSAPSCGPGMGGARAGGRGIKHQEQGRDGCRCPPPHLTATISHHMCTLPPPLATICAAANA